MCRGFPVYILTLYGVQSANPVAIDTARAYGLSRFSVLFRIILPSAAGYIGTAVRLYAIISVLVAISVEMIMGGGGGLGVMLTHLAERADYAPTYVLVFLLGVLGLVLTAILQAAEQRILAWHPSHRKESAE